MKSAIKQGIRSVLGALGYSVRQLPQCPPEMSAEEWDLIQQIISRQLTMVSVERLTSTLLATKYVVSSGIEGAFVECGVWRGGNSILASCIFRKLNALDRGIFLFDTFSGMTDPTEADYQLQSGRTAASLFKGVFGRREEPISFADLPEVMKNFDEFGFAPGKEIRFVKGDILSTLKDSACIPEKISVLRLDTDWYESTKLELEVLYPRLSQGGVLIIDDYGDWAGAKKAVDEYFMRSGQRIFLQPIDYTGRIGVKV